MPPLNLPSPGLAWYSHRMFPVSLPSPFQPAPAAASPLAVPALGVGRASSMPADVAANPRMAPVPAVDSLARDYSRQQLMITNPRLAPSTVTTEQAFQARNLLAPQFQHNALATRMARTSNLYAEAPRFRNQLDIFA